MHPPTISSPHRFGLYVCLSLIALSLLYTNLCMSPARPCPGIFHRDFTFSFKVQLHWARQGGASADSDDDAAADDATNTTTTTTSTHKNKTLTTTTTNKDMGVDDLYQYALASPRVRNDKDRSTLRRYLLSYPQAGSRQVVEAWREKKKKKKKKEKKEKKEAKA